MPAIGDNIRVSRLGQPDRTYRGMVASVLGAAEVQDRLHDPRQVAPPTLAEQVQKAPHR